MLLMSNEQNVNVVVKDYLLLIVIRQQKLHVNKETCDACLSVSDQLTYFTSQQNANIYPAGLQEILYRDNFTAAAFPRDVDSNRVTWN